MHSNNVSLNIIDVMIDSNRLVFVLTFLLVSILSLYFISNVWIKWSASPVIITLNSFSMSITDLPFPAVTICNMNQAQSTSVQQLSRNSDEYSIVQSICAQAVDNEINNTKSGKWPAFRKILLKVIRIMKSKKSKYQLTFSYQVSQSCEDMLISCSFGGIEFECLHIFNSILTDEGLCCVFNGVHRKFLMKTQYE